MALHRVHMTVMMIINRKEVCLRTSLVDMKHEAEVQLTGVIRPTLRYTGRATLKGACYTLSGTGFTHSKVQLTGQFITHLSSAWLSLSLMQRFFATISFFATIRLQSTHLSLILHFIHWYKFPLPHNAMCIFSISCTRGIINVGLSKQPNWLN